VTKRLLVATATALFLAGCGGDECSRSSPCPNDPRPTEAEIKECREKVKLARETSTRCVREGSSLSDCSYRMIACGPDGKIDATRWGDAVTSGCAAQAEVLTDCVMRDLVPRDDRP